MHYQALVKTFSKPHVMQDGLAIYRRLQSDDQDSVRLLTVEDLIALAQQLSPAEVKDQLLKQIRATVGDKSWRVRYMAAAHFNEVCHVHLLSSQSTSHHLCSLQRSLVRNSSVRSLSATSFNFSRIMRLRYGLLPPARSLVCLY
jgi:hypothetical protein